MSDLHKNTQTTKLLREIEDIVLDLDKAIESNEIDHKSNALFKQRYRNAVSSLPDYATQNDSRFYVIDEATALFAWIDKEKDFTRTKIQEAVAKKGDALLISASGRKLAATYKPSQKSNHDKSKGDFATGWLGFFYLVIAIVVVFSLPITLIVAMTMLLTPPQNAEGFVGLVLFGAYACLGIAYIIFAQRRSKRAIPVAVVLFSLLTLSCIFLIILSTVQGDDVEAAGVVYVFFSFLILCGLATTGYYVLSSHARRVFHR